MWINTQTKTKILKIVQLHFKKKEKHLDTVIVHQTIYPSLHWQYTALYRIYGYVDDQQGGFNQCRIDRQNAEFFTRIALYTIKRTKKDLCILCVPCVLIMCLTYPNTMTQT